MGLFKRIFGKADKEREISVEKDVQKIKSGINSKVYPILKPGSWVGIKAGCLFQTLLGSNEKPELVIAYGYNGDNNFVFLTHDDLKDRDSQEIVQEAYANLDNEKVVVSHLEEDIIITASGNDFSSEKILSKTFMDELHRTLNSDELIVSIPRRTVFYALAGSADGSFVNTFVNVHKYTYEDDSFGNAPISELLFIVKNGVIERILDINQGAN